MTRSKNKVCSTCETVLKSVPRLAKQLGMDAASHPLCTVCQGKDGAEFICKVCRAANQDMKLSWSQGSDYEVTVDDISTLRDQYGVRQYMSIPNTRGTYQAPVIETSRSEHSQSEQGRDKRPSKVEQEIARIIYAERSGTGPALSNAEIARRVGCTAAYVGQLRTHYGRDDRDSEEIGDYYDYIRSKPPEKLTEKERRDLDRLEAMEAATKAEMEDDLDDDPSL